jgi:hypothetical protein
MGIGYAVEAVSAFGIESTGGNSKTHDVPEYLEARVGFEPTDGGFADLSLRPLGYRAGVKEYSETAVQLSVNDANRKRATLSQEESWLLSLLLIRFLILPDIVRR